MKILVANIGSTSFKFRLFDMGGQEREIASGSAERVGDYGAAIDSALAELVRAGKIRDKSDLGAVAFKAIMAGDAEPVALVDEKLLARMEQFAPVAPAHNPPYIAAMRMFAKELPGVPLVAAFEPGFHRTNPDRRRYYAVPPAWAAEYGVKRYGFHGASHAYIAAAMGELQPGARRVISCHLGGSSSLCAILDGQSVATSMGLSPQSGLPQSNRAGDFDPFAFPLLAARARMDTPAVLEALGSQGGLAALSGTSGDMRDIEQAMAAGSEDARLAFEVYVTAVRDYLGAYLVELGGADAIVFTGGIGQKSPAVRAAVCAGLEFAGIAIDESKNAAAKADVRLDATGSKTAVWVVATNEELIVARQAKELIPVRRD
ncbi:MAG: acetate/propionate family kinase [Phycisphaerae bacterium]